MRVLDALEAEFHRLCTDHDEATIAVADWLVRAAELETAIQVILEQRHELTSKETAA